MHNVVQRTNKVPTGVRSPLPGLLVDFWILAVLVGFFIIRIIGSNSFRHLLLHFRVGG